MMKTRAMKGVVDPGLSWGRQLPKFIFLQTFCRKLHNNDKSWTPRRARVVATHWIRQWKVVKLLLCWKVKVVKIYWEDITAFWPFMLSHSHYLISIPRPVDLNYLKIEGKQGQKPGQGPGIRLRLSLVWDRSPESSTVHWSWVVGSNRTCDLFYYCDCVILSLSYGLHCTKLAHWHLQLVQLLWLQYKKWLTQLSVHSPQLSKLHVWLDR